MADMKVKFTQARYEELSKQLDEAERKSNNTLFKKVQRKVRSLYMSKDQMQDLSEKEKASQRAITGKHYSLLKRVRQMEGQM
jgi:hypothetical protein